jgi:hypothetical protein
MTVIPVLPAVAFRDHFNQTAHVVDAGGVPAVIFDNHYHATQENAGSPWQLYDVADRNSILKTFSGDFSAEEVKAQGIEFLVGLKTSKLDTIEAVPNAAP